MEIDAAVIREVGGTFGVERVVLDDPGPGEVLVELAGTGVCHTDLLPRDEVVFTVPGPMVLGHEGAGTVVEVGPGVYSVAAGDRVILSYASCGVCAHCFGGAPNHCDMFGPLNISGARADGTPTLRFPDGEPIFGHWFGQSSFASHAISRERNLVKVNDTDLPLEHLGPFGCGVITGAGAVLSALRPPAGSSILIQGCGTVGLSAVMAAAVSGCGAIIATDLHQSRRDLALELGATHVIDPLAGEPILESMIGLLGRPVEAAIDTSGAAAPDAVDAIGPGGTAVLLGAMGDLPLKGGELVFGKSVKGVALGDAVPQILVPRLLTLHSQGRFPFEKLIKTYPLADINIAIADSESGATVKPVIMAGS